MRRISQSLRGSFASPSFSMALPASTLFRCCSSSSGGKQWADDWACPNCSCNNFSRRVSCYSCRLPKPTGAKVGSPSHYASGHNNTYTGNSNYNSNANANDNRMSERRFVSAVKPGDWVCRRCSAHNFASRSQCIDCGNNRPSFTSVNVRGRGRHYEQQNVSSQTRSGQGGQRSRNNSISNTTITSNSDKFSNSNNTDVGANENTIINGDGGTDKRTVATALRPLSEAEESLFGDLLAPGAPPPKAGDWRCGGCRFINFASRVTCKECGAPSSDPRNASFSSDAVAELLLRRRLGPAATSAAHENDGHSLLQTTAAARGVTNKGAYKGPLAGDWSCPRCDYSNFASRAHCNRCGSEKAAAASASSSHSQTSASTTAHASNNNSINNGRTSSSLLSDEEESLEAVLSEVLGSEAQR